MLLKKQKRGANTNDYEINIANVSLDDSFVVDLPRYVEGETYVVPTLGDVYGSYIETFIAKLKENGSLGVRSGITNIKVGPLSISADFLTLETLFGVSYGETITYPSKGLIKENGKFKLVSFQEDVCHGHVVSRYIDLLIQYKFMYNLLTKVQQSYPQGRALKDKIISFEALPFIYAELPVSFIMAGSEDDDTDFIVSGYCSGIISSVGFLVDYPEMLNTTRTLTKRPKMIYKHNDIDGQEQVIYDKVAEAFDEALSLVSDKLTSEGTVVNIVKIKKREMIITPELSDLIHFGKSYIVTNPQVFAGSSAIKFFSPAGQVISNIKKLDRMIGTITYDNFSLVRVDMELGAGSLRSFLEEFYPRSAADVASSLISVYLADMDRQFLTVDNSKDDTDLSKYVYMPHIVELLSQNLTDIIGYDETRNELIINFNGKYVNLLEGDFKDIFGHLVSPKTVSELLNFESETFSEVRKVVSEVLNLIFLLSSDLDTNISVAPMGSEIVFNLPESVIKNGVHFGIFKGNRTYGK